MPAQPDRAVRAPTETYRVKFSAQRLHRYTLAITIIDHHGNPRYTFYFIFFFFSHIQGIRKSLGQGWNLSRSCDLC